jgi:hypothetical protein
MMMPDLIRQQLHFKYGVMLGCPHLHVKVVVHR